MNVIEVIAKVLIAMMNARSVCTDVFTKTMNERFGIEHRLCVRTSARVSIAMMSSGVAGTDVFTKK